MGNTRSSESRTASNEHQKPYSSTKIDEEVISFDPEASFALCVGLDKQAQPTTTSLGELVEKDTLALADSLSKNLGLPQNNVKTIISSKAPKRLLTINGLATLLVEAAWRVGPEGILIFTFSGHGITVAPDEYSLMLVDHGSSTRDYIVAGDFLHLVLHQNEAEFKGKKVLLVLDCCHAGGIPEKLASTEEGRTKFCAIAACNSYQSSIQLFPLRHSVFTYFLLDALSLQLVKSGEVSMSSIHEHIHKACSSLSSLFIPYNPSKKSTEGFKVDPVVISVGEGKEDVDAPTIERQLSNHEYSGRFDILHTHWLHEDFEQIKVSFSANCRRWLKKQVSGPLESLSELGQLEKKEVFDACLSAMCQSMACIHLYEECPTIGTARQFIKDFIEVYAAIERASEDSLPGLTPKQVESGIAYYYGTVQNAAKLNALELKILYNRIMGFEDTDSRTPDVSYPNCISFYPANLSA